MKYLKLVLLVVLCSLSVGCTAARQNPETTAASTEWRLKSLEESFLNFKEEQRLQADRNMENSEKIQERLDELEGQIAELKEGTMMAAPPDMTEGEKGWVTDLKPEEDNWVEGQKTPQAQTSGEQPWDKVPGPAATVTTIPEPKVVERTPAPAKVEPKPAPKTTGPKALYDKGYAKYSAGDFAGARALFDQFLEKYPKDKLAPNALYWKGETYYSQKNYPQAILTFKEVTGRFPKNAKAAAALLKIGMSYEKVGDVDNAMFYLRALIEDFPNSSPAGIGRKELSRMGG